MTRVLTTGEFVREYERSQGWALIVGSAASMGWPCHAPMAPATIYGLLVALGLEIQRRNSDLGNAFCSRISSVDRDALSRNLKLEVGLTHVNAHAHGLVESLLGELFVSKAPNINHKSIATLHRNSWAPWIVTTNFDDGLEATGEFRGFAVRPAFSSDQVVKLHGDARTGDGLVATLEAMATQRALNLSRASFEALVGLGVDRILTIGYSGTGDLDVVPALRWARQRDVKIWWSVRDPRVTAPLPVEGVVVTDLESDEPIKNVLVGLSGVKGEGKPYRQTEPASSLEVSARLNSRVRGLPLAAAIRIPIALLLEANLGLDAAYLLSAADQFEPGFDNREQWHYACERLSAYKKAEGYLARSTPHTGSEQASWLARRAFLFQEAGEIPRSRELYQESITLLNTVGAADFRTEDFARRGYLESNIDQCSRGWSVAARMRIAEKYHLRSVCEMLSNAAWQADPLVEELLALRSAQIELLLAANDRERRRARDMALEALRDAISLQHADGEGEASRFLIKAFGWSGLQVVRQCVRASEYHTRAPSRDTLKRTPSFVLGLLPMALLPWKMQPPFSSVAKRTADRVWTLRLGLQRRIWKHQFDATLRRSRAASANS